MLILLLVTVGGWAQRPLDADSAAVADTVFYTVDSLGIKRDARGKIIPTKWVEPAKQKTAYEIGRAHV